jgi:hypothetical protein
LVTGFHRLHYFVTIIERKNRIAVSTFGNTEEFCSFYLQEYVESTETEKLFAFCISVIIAANTSNPMGSINSSQNMKNIYDGIFFPALPYLLICSHKNRSS